MAIQCCDECGFLCEEYQLSKTKGECPRCAPEKAKEFRERIRSKGLLKEH